MSEENEQAPPVAETDTKRKRDDDEEEEAEATKRPAVTEEAEKTEEETPASSTPAEEETPASSNPAEEETPASSTPAEEKAEAASTDEAAPTTAPTTETAPEVPAPAVTTPQMTAEAQQAAINAAAHAAAQAAMTQANLYGAMGVGGVPGAGMGGAGMVGGLPRPAGAGDTSIVVDCPPTLVGRIIGKGGETIRDLQIRSGCHIQVDQNFPEGQPRKISVQGNAQAVELAKQLINNVFNSGPQGSLSMMGIAPIAGLPAESGPTITKLVDCPQTVVGRVIGKGGETIKLLQMQSGCRIQIDQNFPEGMPRKITIQGSPQQVAHASSLVDMKINEGGSGALIEGKPSMILDCPKTVVGRVIGRGGETINLLQIQSGAKIQIDQKVPEGMPCKVEISGDAQTTELAVKLVTDLINGGNPQALGGGAGGMGNHMGGGMRMGGYQQQPAYGGYQQPAYGGYQQPAYGGYQQPAYGGYQQPPPAYAAPKVSNWSEHDDGSGNKYWYNAATGQSQWDKPPDA